MLHASDVLVLLVVTATSRLGDGTEQFCDTQVMVEYCRLDGSDLSELVGNCGVEFQQLSVHRFNP